MHFSPHVENIMKFQLIQVLRHLRHCELRPDVRGVLAPAFQFKRSFSWLEPLRDPARVHDATVDIRVAEELSEFVWRRGPYLFPLTDMLAHGTVLRGQRFAPPSSWRHHMGLGAAVHLSSVLDPVEILLKQCAVNDLDCSVAVSRDILEKAAKAQVTEADIVAAMLTSVCGKKFRTYVNVGSLSSAARRRLWEAMPWVVRANPHSFPFLLPNPDQWLAYSPEKGQDSRLLTAAARIDASDVNTLCDAVQRRNRFRN